jgi:hypothetical protein
MPKTIEEAKRFSKRPAFKEAEEQAKVALSNLLGITLQKEKLTISGKSKEFDLVNIKARVVGDVKRLTAKGVTSAEEADMCMYVWLMEKLEESTGWKWRKFIVGIGRRSIFERFARNYGPWLGDVEIYFIGDKGKVSKLRNGV